VWKGWISCSCSMDFIACGAAETLSGHLVLDMYISALIMAWGLLVGSRAWKIVCLVDRGIHSLLQYSTECCSFFWRAFVCHGGQFAGTGIQSSHCQQGSRNVPSSKSVFLWLRSHVGCDCEGLSFASYHVCRGRICLSFRMEDRAWPLDNLPHAILGFLMWSFQCCGVLPRPYQGGRLD
jgi:hypothetical protein